MQTFVASDGILGGAPGPPAATAIAAGAASDMPVPSTNVTAAVLINVLVFMMIVLPQLFVV
jgi:hypothetical protein